MKSNSVMKPAKHFNTMHIRVSSTADYGIMLANKQHRGTKKSRRKMSKINHLGRELKDLEEVGSDSMSWKDALISGTVVALILGILFIAVVVIPY